MGTFGDYWNPRILGELNGQHVKAVKLKGSFVWHQHDHEDELFFVVKGKLKWLKQIAMKCSGKASTFWVALPPPYR